MGKSLSWLALALTLACGSNAPGTRLAAVSGTGGAANDSGTAARSSGGASGGSAGSGSGGAGSGGETIGDGGDQGTGGASEGGASAGGSRTASGGSGTGGALDAGSDAAPFDAGPQPVFTRFATCPKLDNACPPPNTWTNGFTCDYVGMTSSGTEGWRPCWKTPCNDPGVVPACGELGIWGVDITWDAQTGYHCSITTNDLYYYMHARGQTCD